MKLKDFFKKKDKDQVIAIDDPNYLDIQLGLDEAGRVFFNFIKDGELHDYMTMSPEDRQLILQVILQTGTVLSQLENQQKEKPKYLS